MLTQKQIEMLQSLPESKGSKYTNGASSEMSLFEGNGVSSLAGLSSVIKENLETANYTSLEAPEAKTTADAGGEVTSTVPATPEVEISTQHVTDPAEGGNVGELPPPMQVDVLMKEALKTVSTVQVESLIASSKVLSRQPMKTAPATKTERKIGDTVKLKSGKDGVIEAISYGDDFKTINALKIQTEGKSIVIKESEVVDPALKPKVDGEVTGDAAGSVDAGAPAVATQTAGDAGGSTDLPTPTTAEEPNLTGEPTRGTTDASSEWDDSGYPA